MRVPRQKRGVPTKFWSFSPALATSEDPSACSRLGLEAPTHDVAKAEDIVIRQRVVNVEAFLPARDEPGGAKHLEVLGDVGRAEPRHLCEVADRPLSFAKRSHQVKAGWLGQGAEPFRHQLDFPGGQTNWTC